MIDLHLLFLIDVLKMSSLNVFILRKGMLKYLGVNCQDIFNLFSKGKKNMRN